MASLSSSSVKIQQTLFQRSLINREKTVFRKASQLSALCKIEVCLICYGLYGELKTWPEDREKVRDIARRYIELSVEKRRKSSVSLNEFLKKIEKDDSSNKKKKKKVSRGYQVKYPVWDLWSDNYSEEQRMELIHSWVRNRTRIQNRLAVVEARGQRRTHNTNMADEELMMTSPRDQLQQHSNQNTYMTDEELMMTSLGDHLQHYSNQNTNMANQDLMMNSRMNHLQQHSNQNTYMANQDLMMNSTMNYLQQHSNQNTYMADEELMMTSPRNHLQQHSNQFLYENGIFSPFPVSALYLNQEQSLAPIPSAKAMYPNSNVGNYSRLLGAQESGIINRFQNMNICTYVNPIIMNCVNNFPSQIDQFKGESYSSLLGQGEYGINEFESTNMYDCNLNTGDYSGLLREQETGNVNMQDYNNNANYGLSH